MNKTLNFAAVTEILAGLAMLIVPSLVGQLLFGQQLAGVAIPVARVTGIAWIALGPCVALLSAFGGKTDMRRSLCNVGF